MLRNMTLCLALIFAVSCREPEKNDALSWQEGYLEIHQIHTGRGDAAFFILPDGTTMLFDAGEAKQRTKDLYYPIYPSDSLSPGAWIAHYINQVNPGDHLDYAVISHFHSDHYGFITEETPYAKNKAYQLSGITEVGDLIDIHQMLDRAYPDFTYPRPMLNVGLKGYDNYMAFIQYHLAKGMKAGAVVSGVNDQITLVNNPDQYPGFNVRNVKSNQWIWTGEGKEVSEFIFNPPLEDHEKVLENPLSIVLKINYGDFDLFTGGDLPGVDGPGDYDMETPMADVVGEVDVLTLNHHGYKDANNPYFVEKLKPQVAIHPAIHDLHYQPNVLQNLADNGVEAYSIAMGDSVSSESKLLVPQTHESTQGHVMIRVSPGGKTFEVYSLIYEDLQLKIKSRFGPYTSRK